MAAAPILPIPTIPAAGGALAARSLRIPTTIPSGGAVLVGMTGFFMAPRLLMAPPGTRLQRGVVAVPAAAAPAAGSGAMRWALAAVAVAAPAGDASDDDDEKKKKDDDAAFYGALAAEGLKALEMLSCIEPPPRLIGKARLVRDAVEKAVKKAKAKEEKLECVKAFLYGIYGVVDLGKDCTPPAAVLSFEEQWLSFMLSPAARMGDTEAMMESVTRAMRIARLALRRCIGHTADGAKKLLRFEDPHQDW